MNKADPPRSYGVFKPVGHTVLVFPDLHKLEQAALQLTAAGIDLVHVTRYSPQEMTAQVEADIQGASILASVGQELNLVKAHGEFAGQGCHFMIVPTDEDAVARQVADIAQAAGAVAAHQYGSLIIEDLIVPADGKGQVFESPDRGLDIKSPSAGPTR